MPLTLEEFNAEIERKRGGKRGLAADVAVQAGHGLARGAVGLPGIPGDIGQALGGLIDWGGRQLGFQERTPEQEARLREVAGAGLPTSRQLQEAVLPPRPTPSTATGEYVGDVAQYLPAAALPIGVAKGGATLGRIGAQLGYGAASGAATEGVRRAEAIPEPLREPAAIAAGFAPALAGAGVSWFRGQRPAAALVKEATSELGPEDWQRGLATQQAGHDVGVPLMGAESLAGPVGNRSAIAQLASDVATTPGGAAPVSRLLQQRPQAMQRAIRAQLAKIGDSASFDEVLAGVHKAANTAIEQARAQRSAVTTPLYKAADKLHVPPQATQGVIAQVDDALQSAGRGTALEARLLKLRDQLHTPRGAPETSTAKLSSVYKNLRDDLSRPAVTDPGSVQLEAGVLRGTSTALRDMLQANNPAYAQAERTYQELSRRLVEPVAGTREAPSFARQIAETKNLRSLLDPEKVTPEMIGELAQTFKAAGKPKALNAFVREYLEVAADRAMRSVQTGENVMSGVNFRNAVVGTPRQQANLQAAFDAIDPSGATGAGTMRLFDVLAATGKVGGVGSQTAGRLATQHTLAGPEASVGLMAAGAAAAGGYPAPALGGLVAAKLGGWVRDLQTRAGARKLAEALTAPDSVQRLKALARMDPATPRARATALAILEGSQKEEE